MIPSRLLFASPAIHTHRSPAVARLFFHGTSAARNESQKANSEDALVAPAKAQSKLEQLQNHPRVKSVVSDVRMYQTASSQAIKKTYFEWWQFYEQFSHMDEVRAAHDKVISIQQELQTAQHRRVELQHKLMVVQNEVKQHQAAKSRLDDDTDPRYLQLAKVMIEAGQREKQTAREYHIEDERERNLFTHLTAAVMASHEKEKIYANTVKYWSIIGSLLGASLGIIGTALGYHYRQNTIARITDRYTEQVQLIEAHIDRLTGDLQAVLGEMHETRRVHERALDMLEDVRRRDERRKRSADGPTDQAESWAHWTYRQSSWAISWLNPWSSSADGGPTGQAESWAHWTYRQSSWAISWLNPWSYGRSM